MMCVAGRGQAQGSRKQVCTKQHGCVTWLRRTAHFTKMNGILSVLFGVRNAALGPQSAGATHRFRFPWVDQSGVSAGRNVHHMYSLR
jgi:hypothetical protein